MCFLIITKCETEKAEPAVMKTQGMKAKNNGLFTLCDKGFYWKTIKNVLEEKCIYVCRSPSL